MTLSIDIETYSPVDLSKGSVYTYSEHPDFQILLFGYAFDDDPVTVVDLMRGEVLPGEVYRALTDPSVTKTAFNAQFERVCISRYLSVDYLPPEQWQCTMVWSSALGLPRSLAGVGDALGLSEEQAKMKEGKELVRYFCKPCKATKANGGRTRNMPGDAPEKWKTFIEYNRRDVETERTIRRILEPRPLPPVEWKTYWMDQRINDRGVLVDLELAASAIQMSEQHNAELTQEAVNLTGLENVNSVSQLKGWLGVEGSLDKKTVKAMRDSGNLSLKADRALAIRQELGKTSVTKYEAMIRCASHDSRVRGLFQFYGAGRTGRWAGRNVQVQNLPQNHIEELDFARQCVKEDDREAIRLIFGSVPDTLSQLIRTAFIPRSGCTFAVADFSAIEARVLAWLAGESWRQEVFAKGGDIYCASASQMFKVPVVKHGVNGHLRQKGKIAELALGYGGSVGALKAMGALEMGLTEDELQPLVDAWRATNSRVTAFWWDVDRMVRNAILHPGSIQRMERLAARRSRKLLTITLPSGRSINYWEPDITLDPVNGRENVTYYSTEAGRWLRVESYGPKFVENIVQATARDCLRDAMLRVCETYPGIVMHVHDEMIVEVPQGSAELALRAICEAMGKPIPWAPGLLLRGDGYLCDYYKKD
jgi:DNA polymerase